MARLENLFFSRKLALYHITENGPKYLELVSVPDIRFYPERFLRIEGILPNRRDLLEMEDGAEFVLVHCDCTSAITVFESTLPIIRFKNCKIKSRNIFDSVNRAEDKIVSVSVLFECDTEVLDWGALWQTR